MTILSYNKRARIYVPIVVFLIVSGFIPLKINFSSLDREKELHETPTSSDSGPLPATQYVYKSGYCSNTGSIYISWSCTTSIEVRAMFSTEFSFFKLNGEPYGQLLSTDESGAGYFYPFTSDTWYIVFWNRYGSYTYITYDATFNSAPPKSITVTQPSAASSYQTGSAQSVVWTTEGDINSVSIQLYKGTSMLYTIATNTFNDGSQGWTVPYSCTTDSDYRVKVLDSSQSSIYDYSPYFTIVYVEPKTLTLSQPDSNSAYIAGSTQTMEWDSTGSISNIKVELYKGNSLFSNIYSSTGNDGTESWLIPLSCTTGNDYRIKITDTSTSSIYDYSDYFIIYAAGQKTINVIKPSISSCFIAGTTRSLIWNSTGPINDVKIELFKNDFYNQTIYSSIFNDGNELWSIPLNCTTSDNYEIKISDNSNSSIYAFSEYFTIETPKTITIEKPDDSSIYVTESSYSLIWQTTGEINYVSIELYQGNVFYTLITGNTTNDGIEEWTVPSTCLPAQNYCIKITDLTNSSIFDYSDYFTLEILKTITVLKPIGSSKLTPGSRCEIKWNTTGNIYFVDIELYQNLDLVLTIAEQHANVQNFNWSVPDSLLEGDYSLKIVDANDHNVYIFSAAFTIALPPEPDYTILIITLSITIPVCLISFISLYARKKVKVKREKETQIQEKINSYLKEGDLLIEEMNFKNALSKMEECLEFIQKEGVEGKFGGIVTENIKKVKVTHIKSQILDLGSKYNQIFLSEIIEKTNIDDPGLIKNVINDMIANSEIYAKISEQNQMILFDLETNIEEIDKLMDTFKKWEEKGYNKKI